MNKVIITNIKKTKQQQQITKSTQINKQMQQKQKPYNQTNNIILINTDTPTHQLDFQSITTNPYLQQQQQQVMIINSSNPTNHYQHQQQQQDFIEITNSNCVDQSQLQRQFQQIRFVSGAECNLMDMDISVEDRVRSVLELSPYQYEGFIDGRVVEIQMPQLITEGYIMSYKLYQIKTMKKVKEEGRVGMGLAQQQKRQKQQSNSNDLLTNNQAQQSQRRPNTSSPQPSPQTTRHYDTCVSRRFSDFQYLNQLLIANYGGYIIPLLPQKNFWAIINLEGREYAQSRTKSLVNYLNRLFTHKKLRQSLELKNFLFQQDSKFSTQKGEYLQKNSHLEDKLISLSTGAYEYGKALYNKFVGGGGEKGREEEEIRLSKNKLNKDDLVLSEYEIVVAELMRIMSDMKALVGVTIEEMRTVDDVRCLFSSSLTDTVNVPTNVNFASSMPLANTQEQSFSTVSFVSTTELQEEFEEISQFVFSCYAAIQRRKSLKQEIQSLKQQEEVLTEKYKNSPRSPELDIVRSKLKRLNKMNETYAEELIKELESHVDESKGMLKMFVVKFEKLRKKFITQDFN